jgi:nucleotide-binding universal stress UspA family protein
MPVVVGYDGSEQAQRAVHFAAQEAEARGLPLAVLTVWDEPTVDLGMGSGAVIDPQMSEVLGRRAVQIAAEGAALVADRGLTVTSSALPGPAAAALVGASRDAALVVLGSRGDHGMADLLLGGVSRQVAAHADCPVIVVRGDDANRHPRVVVGIDGSEQAGRALDFAFDEASRRGWALRVVHAWDVSVIGFDVDDSTYPAGGILDDIREAETRLSAEILAGHTARYPEVDVEVRIQRGAAAKVLVASAVDCGLLVTGSRGRGGFRALLLGSVSHKVLHHAPCSVAIVH